MPYVALVATSTIVFVVLFLRALREKDERQDAERKAHREEVSHLHESHRQEIAQLNQARIEEVASLCQRIQAPEVAVVDHAAQNAQPDPPPLDLEDDAAVIANAEARMEEFARDLEGVT
jgi:uncharacterized membrane protein YhiD involved in acid resistance